MSAIQGAGRTLNFGSGRLFQIQPGGTPKPVQNLVDISVDFKVDLKEAYAEGGYPIGVADSHRSIDIAAKYYNFDPVMAALALNGTSATGATSPWALDEAHNVPATTTYTVTLAQSATYIPGTLYVLGFPLTGGVPVPTPYAIVAPGSEAAGVSCSVTSGVLTFASGDASIAVQCSYQYGATVGTRVTVNNQPQNSSKAFQLSAIKRDNADLDNSTAQVIFTFFAVRAAGVKSDHKEGDYTVHETQFKAYANGAGQVYTIDFVNV